MARVLLLNPSKWGRGITPIWVASHAAVLRARGHEVRLFDCTFFRDWAQDEVGYNTVNGQYRPTRYAELVRFDDTDVRVALQRAIDGLDPDVIFFAAISSHIHGEGEYVAIQYAHELISSVTTRATIVAGGLQPTADPERSAARFPRVHLFVGGESELVLAELVEALAAGAPIAPIAGLVERDGRGGVQVHARQPILHDLDVIPPYDYSLFDDAVFLRPYNGEVVRACDYELSRGCIYTCTYCVETVIQRYYGFTEATARGALRSPKQYLRHKSAARVFDELRTLHERHGVTLVRCQDTNFLTIERSMLLELADRMDEAALPIRLYVETRPEGIDATTIPLLRRLRVDGVGMGVELSTQSFREQSLHRFADQARIVAAFAQLREAGIRRTAYNIIGLPDQDERSILDTIELNRQLDPDNVTVAFYSPYLGTAEQRKSAGSYFAEYEDDLDAQLRTRSRHDGLSRAVLEFYKRSFVRLVREGLEHLPTLRAEALAGGGGGGV